MRLNWREQAVLSRERSVVKSYSLKTHGIKLLLVSGRCIAPLAVVLLMFLINGCTTTPKGQTAICIPMHGNFCGPGHPSVHNKTSIENVIELMLIKPIDDIDAACRRHDICYELSGYFNQNCDIWLEAETKKMNFAYSDKNHQTYCESMQLGIVSPVESAFKKTPNLRTRDPIGDVAIGSLDYLLRQVSGYTLAGVSIAFDSISYQAGKNIFKTCYICNNDKTRRNYDPIVYNLFFNDTLIEILQYKNLVDNNKAVDLRVELGINNQMPYAQKYGYPIGYSMQQQQGHPILSGKWK